MSPNMSTNRSMWQDGVSAHAPAVYAGEVPMSRVTVTRADMHAHSRASSGPAIAALGWIECPECYSAPEHVYEQARRRGMDLVTITDHDTIAGALELVERGFEGVIIGQEVTVHFPEDHCKLHVLVWGLTPELDEAINRLKLRGDVYQFAAWLREHNLAHSLAHPLYSQNGLLSRWHLDRCAMLFRAFETLNGAHSGTHRTALERYLETLTPSIVHRIITEHDLEPLWPRIWEKGRTGGSDDHGLLNIGRTWTEVASVDGGKITDPKEFLKLVMTGHGRPGGVGGHSSLLAHQLTTVGVQYAARRLVPSAGVLGRAWSSKLMRLAGAHVAMPSKAAIGAAILKKKAGSLAARAVGRRRASPAGPAIEAFKAAIGPVLAKYPDIAARMAPEMWTSGSALSEHERMASLADDLHAAMHAALASSAVRAWRAKDRRAIMDHVVSYLAVELAQLPYVFSLFHQNKDRMFVERLERDAVRRLRTASGDGAGIDAERPMRVCLFTDTLADVNGVSRFIQNVADRARARGLSLTVLTSTRIPMPARENVLNFQPVIAGKMPKYEHLEIALPPIVRMLREADRLQPDVIHISTPGPVGMVGWIAAKMLRAPVVGVYHTDFPAYIDQLFDDHAMTYMCEQWMKIFYAPFRGVLTRSHDYALSLQNMGVKPDRIVRLSPGVDLETFNRRHRDTSVWNRIATQTGQGIDPASVKVLYCGRVSVEKDLPVLTSVWKRAERLIRQQGASAELIIVGDGPYRAQMERELEGTNARFLGFRHGQELSAIYASSDLFVFPSTTDTLGQVVMESQASGLPVLVTDQGGPKDVVREGETGFVLAASDINGWAEKIAMLATNPARRREMGDAAFRAMQSMSIDDSFRHFWSVHEQAWKAHLDGDSDGTPVRVSPTRTEPDSASPREHGFVPIASAAGGRHTDAQPQAV